MGEHYYEIAEYPFARIKNFFRPIKDLIHETPNIYKHLILYLNNLFNIQCPDTYNDTILNNCFYQISSHTYYKNYHNLCRMFVYNAQTKKLYHIEADADKYEYFENTSVISTDSFKCFSDHLSMKKLDDSIYAHQSWIIKKSTAIKHERDTQNYDVIILRIMEEFKTMYKLQFIYSVVGSLLYLLLKQKNYNIENIIINLYYNNEHNFDIESGIYITFINNESNINPDYGRFITEMLNNNFF